MKFAIAGIVALASGTASSPVAQRLPNFLPLQLTQGTASLKPTSISPPSYPPVLEPPYNPFTKPNFFPTATSDTWKTDTSTPTETIDPFAKKPDVPTWWPIFKIPIPVDGTALETSSETTSTSALAAVLIPTSTGKEWISSSFGAWSSPTSYAKPSTFVTELVPAASSTPGKNFVFTNLYTTFTIPFVPDTVFAPSAASATPETYAVVPVASEGIFTSQAAEKSTSATPAAVSSSSSKAAEDILAIFEPQTSGSGTPAAASSSPVESSLSSTASPSAPSLDAIVILPATSSPQSTAYIPPPPSTPSASSSSPLPSTSPTPAIAESTPTPTPSPSPSPLVTPQDLSTLKSTLHSLTSTLSKTISTFSAHSRKVSDKLSQLRKWSKQDFNAIAELKVIVDLQTKVLVKVNARVDALEGENERLREKIEGIEGERLEEGETETEGGEQWVGEGVSETGTEEKQVSGAKPEEGSSWVESGEVSSTSVVVPAPAATGEAWTGDKDVGVAEEPDTEDSDEESSDEESEEELDIPDWVEEEPQPEEQHEQAYQPEEKKPQEQEDEEVGFVGTFKDDGPGVYDGVWDGEPTGGW